MPTVNEELFNRTVRHQVYITRFQTNVARRLIELISVFDRDIVRQIQTSGIESLSDRDLRRLDRLLERVKDINEEAKKESGEFLRSELVEFSEAEAEFQAGVLEQIFAGVLVLKFLSRRQIRSAALSTPFQSAQLRWGTLPQQLNEYFRRRGDLITNEIRRGFLEGGTVSSVALGVQGTRAANFEDGILAVGRRSGVTLAKTAINHTANASRKAYFEENDDVVKSVRWLSILDSRTSAICRARDGMIFPVGEGPRPPAHPNCRSTMVPITKSFRELGIDADDIPGLNGKPAQRQTYNEWLKTQPREFVEDVLGKKKAKLYLDGKLSLDKFVDRTGAEMTLKELRAKESEAFDKAGIE